MIMMFILCTCSFAITTSESVLRKFKGAAAGKLVVFHARKYHSTHEPAAFSVALDTMTSSNDLAAWIKVGALYVEV